MHFKLKHHEASFFFFLHSLPERPKILDKGWRLNLRSVNVLTIVLISYFPHLPTTPPDNLHTHIQSLPLQLSADELTGVTISL